jgi:UDP-N-acetylmuramoyl-L-alanyl-D-glutamate--2,6-diaminopimelate ligase
VIIVAGKGHEDYQEIAGVRHHFSDIEEAGAALRLREGGAG